jgi:hypothetical protein
MGGGFPLGVLNYSVFRCPNVTTGGSQWPRGLKRRSTAARLLTLRVRIPPGSWMFLCCECCVLRRANHSSWGVLPTVVRRCVWSRNLVNEGGPAPLGAVAPKTKKQTLRLSYYNSCFVLGRYRCRFPVRTLDMLTAVFLSPLVQTLR